jgi:hypothetical protein
MLNPDFALVSINIAPSSLALASPSPSDTCLSNEKKKWKFCEEVWQKGVKSKNLLKKGLVFMFWHNQIKKWTRWIINLGTGK